jgi:hypothetical protein
MNSDVTDAGLRYAILRLWVAGPDDSADLSTIIFSVKQSVLYCLTLKQRKCGLKHNR